VSLKVLLEESCNEGYLQSTLSAFLPGYRLSGQLINNSAEAPNAPIEPRR
jgi:hypothetical protein